MKALQIASECTPIIKTGGLADVVGSLPQALQEYNVESRVVLPLYEEVGEKYGHLLKVVGSGSITFNKEDHPYTVYQGTLMAGDIEVYLIENDQFLSKGSIYFSELTEHKNRSSTQRFAFFSRAVVDFFTHSNEWQPDVMHCHDWHSGIVPHLVKELPPQKRVKTIFTIHNLAMQGVSDLEILKILGHDRKLPDFDIDWDARDGNIVLLLQGVLGADIITTVSPTYAYEVTTPTFGEGLDKVLKKFSYKLYGILNGIDYTTWNPKTDQFIPHKFELDGGDIDVIKEAKSKNKQELYKELSLDLNLSDKPLIGIVSRLTSQKGFQLLNEIEERLLTSDRFVLLTLGTGSPDMEADFKRWSESSRYIHVVNVFDEGLAHRIYAASDLFLVPSKFEPCGLTQMISMKYGSLPIVHGVGGLKDTVMHDVNGFVFDVFRGEALWDVLQTALDKLDSSREYERLVRKAMTADFSWSVSAKQYALLYEKIINGPNENNKRFR